MRCLSCTPCCNNKRPTEVKSELVSDPGYEWQRKYDTFTDGYEIKVRGTSIEFGLWSNPRCSHVTAFGVCALASIHMSNSFQVPTTSSERADGRLPAP